ncbi:MAG TPA: glycosyltransferase family 2 protein [Verrucomicrobiae bacterium]|nr:glycosyltransferase family 2 protein [Verrucomicrobiae bacterium]
MSLQADQITIAITVYDRRDFIEQSIDSALSQTIPVKVIVVEDCGPDPTLQAFVTSKFGKRIKYVRNPERRGLFGNWNACLENVVTPWVSILHDDDYLKTSFVETMLNLYQAAPGRGLYFGGQMHVDPANQIASVQPPRAAGPIEEVDLRALADTNIVGFEGHLFPVEYVRALGGFRAHSRYCGDWEMWFNLVARYGGVRTNTVVALVRFCDDRRKGTTKVGRAGENYLATIVQRKRNYAYLKRAGLIRDFQVHTLRHKTAMTYKYMIWYGASFSPRILDYNIRLFLESSPSSLRQRIFQFALRIFGRLLIKSCSLFSALGAD